MPESFVDQAKNRAAPAWIQAVAGLCALVVLPALATAQENSEPLNQPNFADDQNRAEIQQNAASSINGQNGSSTEQRQFFGNTPEDIGAQLGESAREIEALFPCGPLTPLHKLWDRANAKSQQATGLEFGLNYTTLYQRAAEGSDPRDAASDDIDFFGQWNGLCGFPGLIAFSSEIRNRYSTIAPSQLGGIVGSAYGTTVGFNSQDYALVQLYWEQGSLEKGARYRMGRMDPALIYDGGRYVSSNYAFLSPAFSDTSPMALPGAGIGLVGAVYPTSNTYLVAGIHDANGSRTQAGFDTFFDVGEYFSAVEFGAFPSNGDEDRGLWHMTFWHVDARTSTGKPSDHGLALTLEQELGDRGNVVPFLRYAYADRGTNPIHQNLSAGVGVENVLAQNEDLIGVAFSWGMPSDRSLRDEYVFEMFYRILITPHTHVTPDLQVIIDPANAPTRDAVAVLGLRLRTLY